MTRIRTLRSLLEHHEGRKNWAYDDHTGMPFQTGDRLLGHLAIGIGHDLTANGLPPYLINMLFDHDSRIAGQAVRDQLGDGPPNPATPRWCALVDLAFNVGHEGFAGFKKMIAAVKREDWDTAADEMLDSKWATQVPARARLDAQLLRTNRWPEDQHNQEEKS